MRHSWSRQRRRAVSVVVTTLVLAGVCAIIAALFVVSVAYGQTHTYLAPSVPGLPSVPSLTQPGVIIDERYGTLTIQPTLPGMPFPSTAAPPGFVGKVPVQPPCGLRTFDQPTDDVDDE